MKRDEKGLEYIKENRLGWVICDFETGTIMTNELLYNTKNWKQTFFMFNERLRLCCTIKEYLFLTQEERKIVTARDMYDSAEKVLDDYFWDYMPKKFSSLPFNK